MHHPRIAYLLLAAGESKRFGQCKQLAKIDFNKTSLLQHSIDVALEVAPGELFLILGAHKEDIRQELAATLDHSRIHVIDSPIWQGGIGESIVAGMASLLTDHYDAAMILLADQVAIKAEQLKAMRDTYFTAPSHIIAAQYNNTLGAPAIFPEHYFEDLLQLQGDQGAKSIIMQEHEKRNVIAFPFESAKWDIDTEQQLSDWQIEFLDDL